MRILFICISMVFANGIMAQQAVPVEYQTPTKKLQQYVSRMLVRNGETTRWSQLPQLKVTSSDPALKKYVELTFAALCQETGITEVGDGFFHVFVGSKTDFLRLDIVREKNVAFRSNGWWYWTNSDGSLLQTLVMASYNEETDASTEPVKKELATNMLKMFGIGIEGRDAAGYSELLGKMLIKFSYQHVPPRTEAGALPRLLRMHWNK